MRAFAEAYPALNSCNKCCTIAPEATSEAIAFVVGKAVGLDAETASADYIQLYRGNASLLAESLEALLICTQIS
jgi:hypothetical protein